ncbi:hypothetical protein ACWEN6_13955 [Sphaerisporangium sp. NPDC004334]
MSSSESPPYRVVDAEGEGWLHHPAYQDIPEHYDTYPRRDLGEMTLAQLREQRGPIREVVAPPSEDCDALRQALTGAGRKAMGTVLVALYQIGMECIERTPNRSDHLLVAGRPGSWESATVGRVQWLGGDITAGRVDQAALEVCVATLRRWLLDGPGVVEVAETLASILGEVTDDLGGWEKMADQWLVRHEGAELIEGWACSRSERHGPMANL